MATTALIVEILFGGLLAMAWMIVVPLCLLFPIEAREVISGIKALSGYSLLLGATALAAAYALGWLVNLLTYHIAQLSYRKNLLRQVVGSQCDSNLYERLRTAVITHKGYEEVVRRLNEATSAHRVARSAGLNFSAIGIIVLILNEDSGGRICGAGALVLGLSFWMLAIDLHRGHMFRLKVAAGSFEEGKRILVEAGEQTSSLPDRMGRWLRASVRTGKGKGQSALTATKKVPQ